MGTQEHYHVLILIESVLIKLVCIPLYVKEAVSSHLISMGSSAFPQLQASMVDGSYDSLLPMGFDNSEVSLSVHAIQVRVCPLHALSFFFLMVKIKESKMADLKDGSNLQP